MQAWDSSVSAPLLTCMSTSRAFRTTVRSSARSSGVPCSTCSNAHEMQPSDGTARHALAS